MSRFLLLDVGAGTLDVLYWDDQSGQHYKAVVRSPVLTIAERAGSIGGNLLVTGVEMGEARFWMCFHGMLEKLKLWSPPRPLSP